jgi:NRAMP (natural resistance-associated macrophage protein)-like metal ion transporter
LTTRGRRITAAAVVAVVGPGLLAGLSDDDPGGITTYSILGADHGYRLLWVLTLSTAMLIVFYLIGIRLGAVTGQGLAGLIRERFGARAAVAAILLLVLANFGTTCAEYAGVASALDLAGVPPLVSVPITAIGVGWLVLGAAFKHIERILLALSCVLGAYILAGILAHPSWSDAAVGSVVPRLSLDRSTVLVVTATIGTTIAPWGLAFIQSYAVDKRVKPDDLRLAHVDVVVGALLTGIIGFFVIVACAATLHEQHRSISDARDAAIALEPLAGAWSERLFAAGLLGAGLLAAAILPLSTAYSVAETFGAEAELDAKPGRARLFYATYIGMSAAAAVVVIVPQMPLVQVLYLTQAVNAILLVPLLVYTLRLARDRRVMGEHAIGRALAGLAWATVATVAVSVVALAVATA